MIIAIGADHRGFAYKKIIQETINSINNETIVWHDMGAYSQERSDYPLFAQAVCHEILQNKAQDGILICGSGVGMAVAANRFPGIYAALAWNQTVAELSRAHDKANVLVIPSDFVTSETALEMVRVWLKTSFLGDRYQERIDQIDRIEIA